jgi:ABC-type branched-subunit amino acid transport system ATPase component
MGGHELTDAKPEVIARAGMVRTFQNLRLFSSHSVMDNVRTGQSILCKSMLSRFSAFATKEELELRREADALIERFGLWDRRDWPAGVLSYGEKKRLEMARALAMRPKVLLLDEPAAGMNAVELEWLMKVIREIGASGVSVVLVEHHMKLIMNVCDNIAVLNFGAKIAEGAPVAISCDPEVITAYLGKSH